MPVILPLLLAVSGHAYPTQVFRCVSPRFHDGDNIRCGARTMRLAGIDAPELAGSPKCRRRGARAWCDNEAALRSRDHLRALGASGEVWCRQVARDDRYGRPIVQCSVNGADLGQAQLDGGFARRWP